MKRIALCVFLCCFSLFSAAAKTSSHSTASPKSTHPALNSKSVLAESGSYDASQPPSHLRVLVALGPSTYFLKDGRPHGLEYALLSQFEAELNRSRAKGDTPLRLQFIAMDAGELIPALLAGKGDIAAGMLPITEGARSIVAYSESYIDDEWCLVGPPDAAISRLDELGDTPVGLSSASLGRRLLEENSRILIEDLPVGSRVESVLAEIDAGKNQYTVASKTILKLWSQRFKNLKVGECVAQKAPTAWAVRTDDRALLGELNRYLQKKSVSMERAISLTQRFLSSDAKAARSEPISASDKLGFFMPMFQTIAAANNLDWMLLAAIGQKESKLSPVVRKNGPTGVMQINPSTARAMGVSDPHGNEGNITAAAKYLAYLRKMFSQQGITDDNQLFFMIAAYNAGEGRLQQIRSRTKAQGLDPNVWVGNVEKVAMTHVSKGMVDYVAAVNRYYLAYQSSEKTKTKRASSSAVK